MLAESDRAHGATKVVGRTHMDVSHGSHYQSKQEKFDSGLDEFTQYRMPCDAVTPVSCTDEDRGTLAEYVFQQRVKTTEAPTAVKRNFTTNVPQVEPPSEVSVDSAIEVSTSCTEGSEYKMDSVVLNTIRGLLAEDEDGERWVHFA